MEICPIYYEPETNQGVFITVNLYDLCVGGQGVNEIFPTNTNTYCQTCGNTNIYVRKASLPANDPIYISAYEGDCQQFRLRFIPDGNPCDDATTVTCGAFLVNQNNFSEQNNFDIYDYNCHSSNNGFEANDQLYKITIPEKQKPSDHTNCYFARHRFGYFFIGCL